VPIALHTQTVIACVWDFDRTLIPGYSQQVLFDEFGIDPAEFWDEVNHLPEAYAERGILVAQDTAYLGHMITYAQAGRMPGLTNDRMRELGKRIPLNPGMPEFLDASSRIVTEDPRFARHGITVEHYIVSTGVRALIEGSEVGSHVNGIWANDFIDRPIPPGFRSNLTFEAEATAISQVGYMIDNTSKTRAIFEINKGVNVLPGVDVNTLIPMSERRVPISHMIYIADGPSDIPVFSVMSQFGGHNLAVFSREGRSNFESVKSLQDQGRVQMIGQADFQEGSVTTLWLQTTIRQIADRIATARERHLSELPGAPGHVT
jgi:hypothetical protein